LKAEYIVNHFINTLQVLKGSYLCGNSEFDSLKYGKLINDVVETYGSDKYNNKIKSKLESRLTDLEFESPINAESDFRAKEPIFSYYC
jgi:hypothetical protein